MYVIKSKVSGKFFVGKRWTSTGMVKAWTEEIQEARLYKAQGHCKTSMGQTWQAVKEGAVPIPSELQDTTFQREFEWQDSTYSHYIPWDHRTASYTKPGVVRRLLPFDSLFEIVEVKVVETNSEPPENPLESTTSRF